MWAGTRRDRILRSAVHTRTPPVVRFSSRHRVFDWEEGEGHFIYRFQIVNGRADNPR